MCHKDNLGLNLMAGKEDERYICQRIMYRKVVRTQGDEPENKVGVACRVSQSH